MADFFSMPPWPPMRSTVVANPPYVYAESSEHKAKPPNGYPGRARDLDRYKVVGFISSGTYGRVYKAVGVNGQSGEFAIKKYESTPMLRNVNHIYKAPDSSQIRKAKSSNTREYPNQHVEKWLFAQSSHIPT